MELCLCMGLVLEIQFYLCSALGRKVDVHETIKKKKKRERKQSVCKGRIMDLDISLQNNIAIALKHTRVTPPLSPLLLPQTEVS